MAVGSEGVGDAGMVRLDKLVFGWVVEALREARAVSICNAIRCNAGLEHLQAL